MGGDCKLLVTPQCSANEMFQRHRPMGGDCKTLAEQAHLSLSLFQRHRPMGGDCKQMTRPSMLLANGVSAPSPHGRGLQVDIYRTISHNEYCFIPLPP